MTKLDVRNIFAGSHTEDVVTAEDNSMPTFKLCVDHVQQVRNRNS